MKTKTNGTRAGAQVKGTGARPEIESIFRNMPAAVTHWQCKRAVGDQWETMSYASPERGVEETEWPIGELSTDAIRARWGPGTFQPYYFGSRDGRRVPLGRGPRVKLTPTAAEAEAEEAPEPVPMPDNPLAAAFAIANQIAMQHQQVRQATITEIMQLQNAQLAGFTAMLQHAPPPVAAVAPSSEPPAWAKQILDGMTAMNTRLDELEDELDDDDSDEEEDDDDSDEDIAEALGDMSPMARGLIKKAIKNGGPMLDALLKAASEEEKKTPPNMEQNRGVNATQQPASPVPS